VAGFKEYTHITKYDTNTYNTKYTPFFGAFSFPAFLSILGGPVLSQITNLDEAEEKRDHQSHTTAPPKQPKAQGYKEGTGCEQVSASATPPPLLDLRIVHGARSL
jgi:hypothetical protein